ncbi:membrane protein [Williamsia sterculiae]|uniref:Membrane protein n=2 Tax=Williamsia sterculiae TaxID=1344003 RepID=A0A1N7DEJ3_9NOCA|nr:membrane protein [Williamsia sterculiae]
MRRQWPVLASVVILTVAGGFIASLRLSQIHDPSIATVPAPPMIASAATRTIDYRLDGQPGDTAQVSFLAADGKPVQAEVALPWTTRVQSRSLTVAAGLMAQATKPTLECRVLIDEVIRSTVSSRQAFPTVNCQVPVS